MLSLGKNEKLSFKTDEIQTENEDLKKHIKELQQTIDHNSNTTREKDVQIQSLDEQTMNIKETILSLTSNLDALRSQQNNLNEKISQKQKTIAQYESKDPTSSRCPKMHILQSFDASNIDTCSQCDVQPISGQQMWTCYICNYNKCEKCYNNKPSSQKNSKNSIRSMSKQQSNTKISKPKTKVSRTSKKYKKETSTRGGIGITINSERGWVQLQKVPADFSDAVQINLSAFVLATKKGIYKYNRKGWKLYVKYPASYRAPTNITLTMDRKKQVLYMFTKKTNKGRMAEINMNNKKWTITKDLMSAGDKPVSLLIDSRVHIFGGDNFHLLWNPFVKSLKCVGGFGDIGSKKKTNFGIVYLEKSNRLLLFGGSNKSSVTNEIWQYLFDEYRWVECGALPTAISSFSWVITNDEKYIVIFTGQSSDILIFDVDMMETKISPVKMPFKNGIISAMLIDNSGQYQVLLRGYIRQQFNKNVGNDVVRLILLWSVTNDIHIFNRVNAEHWKIDVETVLGFFEADNKGYSK